MDISNPVIILDDTVKDLELFKSKNEFKICKPEIFKYGIMVEEVPGHIKEADFDYLQSKLPAYFQLYSDFIKVESERICNLSKDDRKKKLISEIVGVSFGIKYTVELLNTSPNKFKKIGVPIKGKYLDYSVIDGNKEYELETKGTVGNSYAPFKNDILAKKSSQSNKKVFLRFGTIAMINNSNDSKKTKCVIVDDPPNEDNLINDNDTFETQLFNYGVFLSYILDSKYYNKYIKPLRNRQLRRVRINQKKFFTTYTFEGKEFYGECFDYRLIRGELDTFKYSDNIDNLLEAKTEQYGKNKFFIGLHLDVIKAINKKNINYLKKYKSEWTYQEKENLLKFLDIDGILIVKSVDGADEQLEHKFPEEEVAKRLKYSYNQQLGLTHLCGAPCRSREIKGKPCEIKTFREFCHFHR
ncbi:MULTISPECIES: hypothetical protein [Chryseobacterium]|uniref:hypothetical protein n=1 Tax=Chryseobacterium TaxID=59732 RepID=UPI00162903F7|nr:MULTISPECIES: hypothetical protein [Chryseobacterium]